MFSDGSVWTASQKGEIKLRSQNSPAKCGWDLNVTIGCNRPFRIFGIAPKTSLQLRRMRGVFSNANDIDL